MPNHFKMEWNGMFIQSDSIEYMRKTANEILRPKVARFKKIMSLTIINGLTEYATVRVSYNNKKKEVQYWYFPVDPPNKKIHYFRTNRDGTLRYAIERKK